MLRSQDRILTTHTGSLPRPTALTALYVRRSRGEVIDAAELDRVGKAAVHEVVQSRSPPASMFPTTANSSARRSSSTYAIA